jgi:hypothetical protein
MLRIAISRQPAERSSSELLFRVIIMGAGRSKNWIFKGVRGPDDEGEPLGVPTGGPSPRRGA